MRKVALDTNLLVLFCVGSLGRARLESNKRTRGFTLGDFRSLSSFLEGADKLVTLPYVMAELSNLLDKERDWPTAYVPLIRQLLHECEELTVAAKDVFATAPIDWLGLTDAAWIALLDDETILVSADARLVAEALRVGKAALAFVSGEN